MPFYFLFFQELADPFDLLFFLHPPLLPDRVPVTLHGRQLDSI